MRFASWHSDMEKKLSVLKPDAGRTGLPENLSENDKYISDKG